MENQKRCVFALDGVTGMLIATVLLLVILGVLTYFAIIIQQDVSHKPYALKNVEQVRMFSDVNSAKNTMEIKK